MTMVTSGLQPSQRGYCFFPQRSALGWIISPFQGCFSMVNCQWLFVGYMIRRVPRITINHCPKGLKARIISAPSRKGGVSTSGPCSEGWRPELNPNYAIHFSAFTINNGCANVRQWLRQAYSPPNGDIAFSPTLRIGLNYFALSGLFFNG